MMPPLTGPVLTAAEMRAAEAAAIAQGASVNQLMDRAGSALAEAVWRFGGGQPVLILCGPGNNGGDGYRAAQRLKARGLDVRVAAPAPPATDVAKRAALTWGGAVAPFASAAAAPVLLDCLFGTGLSRPLEAEVKAVLQRLRAEARFVIAADLPSGVGSDDGSDLGAIPADLTLALGALKPAHVLQPAAALCGHVRCADIGVSAQSGARVIVRPQLPFPNAADHKYRRGLVTVIAGEMAGAAGLCASAVARSGAGYVVLAGDGPYPGLPLAIVPRTVEAALAEGRMKALVIGPGLGRSTAARDLVARVLALPVPLVLDADALHLLTPEDLLGRAAPTLLTPHEGEFAALFGALPGSKLDRARVAAAACGAVVLLKGADSVIAAPDGQARLSAGASPWLATAGTGDVLAGVAAAMLARGLGALDAAEAAVWLHGRAAALAGPGLIADDLLAALPAALVAAR
ncbi:MAG: NAD(P)H-hydrate dehydratase [Chakrabartia sp.]